MGNSTPYNKDVKIYIETEKQFYNSGSSIQGVVFIQAAKDVKYHALYLRIQGQENCQWYEGSSKNRFKYTGQQYFYSFEFLLQKFDEDYLNNGKHAFPFSLQLSENIPGSFESAKYNAKIEYKLIAYLINYQIPNLRHYEQVPLLIRQPFRQQINAYQGVATTNPKSCGLTCCEKGEVSLEAWFQRNVGYEGQKIKIEGVIDNKNGDSIVNGVKISLMQYTFVSANNGTSRTYSKPIYSRNIGEKVHSGKSKQFNHDFTLPEIKHQTAISTLVANYYRLEVKANIGSLTSDEPEIYSPLFVLKKTYPIKNPYVNKKYIKENQYQFNKPVIFKAPQHYFRKNKNLSIMNFRLEDMVSGESQFANA